MSNDKHIFTTTAGVEIPLRAIPILQAQLVEQAARKEAAKLYGEPVKPTYTIKTDDGGEETHEHDEETIKTNREAKRAWDAWQECLRETNKFVEDRTLNFMFLAGTEAALPESKAWMKRQKFFGVEVPEDDPEDDSALLAHYIKTELLRSVDDINGAQRAISAISGINQEMLAAARATFPGDGQGRDGAGGSDGAVAEPQAGQMDGEPALQRTTDGEGLGEDARRMGRAGRRRQGTDDGA
jgi:hypothetical protein